MVSLVCTMDHQTHKALFGHTSLTHWVPRQASGSDEATKLREMLNESTQQCRSLHAELDAVRQQLQASESHALAVVELVYLCVVKRNVCSIS